MKKLRWLIINGCMLFSLYMGLLHEQLFGFSSYGTQEYFLNISLFMVWFSIIAALVAFLLLSNNKADDKFLKEKMAFPSWFNISFDCFVVGILALTGYFVAAVFYLIHIMFVEAVWKIKEKKLAELKEKEVDHE